MKRAILIAVAIAALLVGCEVGMVTVAEINHVGPSPAFTGTAWTAAEQDRYICGELAGQLIRDTEYSKVQARATAARALVEVRRYCWDGN